MQDTNTVTSETILNAAGIIQSVREPVNLSRVNLKNFIESQDGRILSLDYIKVDGNKRKLIGRLGVKSHLKGGINKVMRIDRPYLTMFDMQAKEYRTVRLDTVSSVRAKGVTYIITG